MMEKEEMKTATQIGLSYGLCNCDDAYKSRRMTAPDCPLHAYPVEEAMEEYANLSKKELEKELSAIRDRLKKSINDLDEFVGKLQK